LDYFWVKEVPKKSQRDRVAILRLAWNTDERNKWFPGVCAWIQHCSGESTSKPRETPAKDCPESGFFRRKKSCFLCPGSGFLRAKISKGCPESGFLGPEINELH
jgi:hypothetical protein